jgi:hypothetical protein
MGGEGIAPHGLEGEGPRGLRFQDCRPGWSPDGQQSVRLANVAAGLTDVAAGKQVEARRSGRDACSGVEFVDLRRAKDLRRRDLGGRGHVEVEFHVNTLLILNWCGAACSVCRSYRPFL